MTNSLFDFSCTDLCSKAVMEAKQWLEEKKIASSSKSDLDLVTYTPNSVVISQVGNSFSSLIYALHLLFLLCNFLINT